MGDQLWRTKYSKRHEVDAFSTHDGFIGNPWEQIATLDNAASGRQGLNTGIYSCMVQVSGAYKQFIACAWILSGTSSWKGLRYCVEDSSLQKSETAAIGIDASLATGGVKAEILHQNKIYFIGSSEAGVGIFNPAALEFSKISWPVSTTIWGPHDFCAYQGTLYCMNRTNTASSGVNIWEIGKNIEANIAFVIGAPNTVTVDSWASEKYEGRGALFTDRTFLYATYQASSVTGLLPGSFAHRMFRLRGNESRVLSYEGENDAIFYADDTVRTNIFTYQDLNPDSSALAPSGQLVTVNWERSGATGVHVWQSVLHGPGSYVEEESVIPPSADNGAWDFYLRCTAKPHVKNGGGERVFNPINFRDYGGNQGLLPELFGGPRVSISSLRPGSVSGCMTIDFKVINNAGDFPAGTPLAVVLKHNRYGHMPFDRGRLRNPSVGSLAENNTVLRIPTTDSGVLYTVEWAYRDNGYLYSDKPAINLFCATTGVS